MAPEMGDTAPAETSGDQEEVSVFIPKAALGGKPVKPGETLSMTVKDVDPETGDVEAVCGQETQEEPTGTQSALDSADLEGEKGAM